MKITEKIHAIKHHFLIPLTNDKSLERYVYSYILVGEKLSLIDSGVVGGAKNIFSYIENLDRNICEIDSLILSHGHPDHIGGASLIKINTKCDVLAHENDRGWIENIDTQFSERPIPGFHDLVEKSVNIDIFIEDNDSILTGADVNIHAYHTPGHSPGSISLYFADDKIIFTADLLPKLNDIPNYDNYFQLRESINKIKQIEDVEILLSSWNAPIKGKGNIKKEIEETELYLNKINETVRRIYMHSDETELQKCSLVIAELGLPKFYANQLSNQAFKSHFEEEVLS